jgi:hypothetical protein
MGIRTNFRDGFCVLRDRIGPADAGKGPKRPRMQNRPCFCILRLIFGQSRRPNSGGMGEFSGPTPLLLLRVVLLHLSVQTMCGLDELAQPVSKSGGGRSIDDLVVKAQRQAQVFSLHGFVPLHDEPRTNSTDR